MFGFTKGKIEIQLNKYNFSPGETIQGNIILKLKKPLTGKELTMRLLGQEKITQGYGTRRSYRTITIFDFEQPLEKQKNYIANQSITCPFKIKIPLSINKGQLTQGKFGTALKVMQTLSGTRSRINWYLIARLKVKGFDIKKTVHINVA